MNSYTEIADFITRTTPLESQFQFHLCLEQPETINLLDYLSIDSHLPHQDSIHQSYQQYDQKFSIPHKIQTPQRIIFNSERNQQNNGNGNNKREKIFHFDSVFKYEQKIKHYFSRQISQICQKALNGLNQNILIYGTQQQSKDKLLIGQSQNPGLFLSVLAYLFEFCHEKGLQDLVTLKLCVALHKNGKFIDIFSRNQTVSLKKDQLESLLLETCPQIIIRNVKTGLKLLNIVLKTIREMREENLTENLILSLKIEIDWEKSKVKQDTTSYCLSKINFIKLANPSVNSSLKGVNKKNIWFVNLFNLLRNSNTDHAKNPIESKDIIQQDNQKLDDFTLFLKESIFQKSHTIYSFTSITNKMSSNECLTALLFSNYLKFTKSSSLIRNIIDLKSFQQTLTNLPQVFKLFVKECNIETNINHLLQKLLHSQSVRNYLEYEYSLVIGQACQKLNKYIFTEELEDFYYAKKIKLQINQDIQIAYKENQQIWCEIGLLRKGIQRKYSYWSQSQPAKEDYHAQILSVIDLVFTMAHHFLLEEEHVLGILRQIGQQMRVEKQQHTNNETNTNPFYSYDSDSQVNQPLPLKIPHIFHPHKKASHHSNQSVVPISEKQNEGSTLRCQFHNRQMDSNKKIQQIKRETQNNQKNKQKSIDNYYKNRSPAKDNLTHMFTNKNVEYKGKIRGL